MSHRQRDTHILSVYDEVATGETDSLGDPITSQQSILDTAAYVYDPARSSAGEYEARDAGETPVVTKEATITHPDANDLETGQYVTLHRRGESPSDGDPVFQLARLVEDNALRGGTGPWRLTLDRLAGTTRGDL